MLNLFQHPVSSSSAAKSWTLKQVQGDGSDRQVRFDLQPHPAAPPGSVRRVMVSMGRDGETLRVRFRIPDDPSQLDLPATKEPRRADGLWERTCFEVFIREEGAEHYYEYNLSPSTEWALYRFESYRSGRWDSAMPGPVVKVSIRPTRFELSARIWAPPLALANWRVGISAVVQESDGAKSYWAIAHPPGEPDFHHPSCFALQLPPGPDPSPRT
jgi:hypothetical protein